MARDFRAKQVRTSLVIASGSLTGSKPNLGLVFVSGSKMANFSGKFLTSSFPTANSVHSFDASGGPVANPQLNLAWTEAGSFGHDVWCLFDGATKGQGNENSERLKGSTVLFLGDVVVSGSLFAENSVVEVDTTTPGHFYVSKDAHLSGGIYMGEQATGVYALRVNPENSAKDNIAANTVQVDDSTVFVAEGESRFGHVSGYGGDGVTISNAGAISAKGNIKSDGEIQTAKIAFTDGDDAITIDNGGFINLSSGLRNTPAVKVTSTWNSSVNSWVKFAQIVEEATDRNDSASAVFLIRFTDTERMNTQSYINVSILLEVAIQANDPMNPTVLNAEVFDANNSDDVAAFDPTTMIELWQKKHDTNPTAALYIKNPSVINQVYVSMLNGNRNTSALTDDMSWNIQPNQTWIANDTYVSARNSFNSVSNQDVLTPRLTEKKYSKVTTSQLTGSAGIAVEMNSHKLTIFEDDTDMVLSSSQGIKIVADDGNGAIRLHGTVGFNNIAVEDYVAHSGDLNTKIHFPDAGDQIKVDAGGVEFIHITEDDSQDKIVFNPGGNDVDFIVKSADGSKDFIKLDSQNHALFLGSDSSGNAAVRVEESSLTVNPANQTVGFGVNDSSGAQLFNVQPYTHRVTITGDEDNDSIFKVKAGADTIVDVTDNTSTGIQLGTSNIPVKVVGNLEVAGTFTKVNTTDLFVKDPVIVLGEGTQTLNSNGGIVICSGSNQAAKPDLVWGRVANDTWGAGVKHTISGSVTTLADMTLANIRGAEIQVGSGDGKITAGTHVLYHNAPGNGVHYFQDGTTPYIMFHTDNDGNGEISPSTDKFLKFTQTSDSTVKEIFRLTNDGNGLLVATDKKAMFGDSGKYIHRSAATVLNLTSDGKIDLNAGADITLTPGGSGAAVRLPADVQLEFGTENSGEYIKRRVSNSGGLLIRTDASNGALELNCSQGNGPVLIGGNSASLKLVFGSGQDPSIGSTHNQWIGANGAAQDADLTLNAGLDIVLNATQQVRVPADIELEFGDAGSGEHIVGDGNDLSLVSGGHVKVNPTTSLMMENDKPIYFDASGNFKIQKGASSLDITGGTINLNATSQVNIPENVDLVFDAVGSDPDSVIKIKGDTSNNLNLSATSGEVKSDTHLNIAASKNLRFTNNDARIYRDSNEIMFRDGSQTTPVSLTTLNTRDVVDHAFRIALGPDRLKASGSFSVDKQDRYANSMGSDIWFYVDSNDAERNKSVFAKELVLSSSLKLIDTNDAASVATLTHTSDNLIINTDGAERARIDPLIGLKLGTTNTGANAGIYFNSATQKLSRADNSFKFSTGGSAVTDLTIGEDNDNHDRTITFGHSTLKTVIGIDDSQNVFAINTDGSFESNNDLEIDTNGNIKVSGSMEIHDDIQITSISPGSAKIDLRRHEEDGIAVNGEDVGEVRFFVSEDGNNYGQLGGILMECAENFAHSTNHGSIMRFRTTAIGGTATANAASLDGEGNFTIGGGLTCNSISMSDDSASALDIKEGNNSYLKFITSNSSEKIEISKSLIPSSNNTLDLGSGTNRFANIYTNDLNLCNEGRGNDVDGTSGNWTIQEGEDSLFVINNITGKKFKMMLQPIEDGE